MKRGLCGGINDKKKKERKKKKRLGWKVDGGSRDTRPGETRQAMGKGGLEAAHLH